VKFVESRMVACDLDEKLGRTLEVARVAQRSERVGANFIFVSVALVYGRPSDVDVELGSVCPGYSS